MFVYRRDLESSCANRLAHICHPSACWGTYAHIGLRVSVSWVGLGWVNDWCEQLSGSSLHLSGHVRWEKKLMCRWGFAIRLFLQVKWTCSLWGFSYCMQVQVSFFCLLTCLGSMPMLVELMTKNSGTSWKKKPLEALGAYLSCLSVFRISEDFWGRFSQLGLLESTNQDGTFPIDSLPPIGCQIVTVATNQNYTPWN